ncbi:MAG: CHASE2 domain-containing protein [Bdellovibrionales bacterium]|nr:CHASE2 domain-containing protein [Bdellovibrionales bacterium]
MKILNDFLKYLIAPFSIGIYVSLAVSFVSWQYYLHKNHEDFSELSQTNQLLSTIDQKSIDFRLLARGPRPGSKDVALLTVDEKAVATVGRWPWPREVIGQAYANALNHGAKVVALDTVFSEDSVQAGREIFNSVSNSSEISPSLRQKFEIELAKRDSDSLFADVIRQNQSKIVVGTFFESEEKIQSTPAHIDRCLGLLFDRTRASTIWRDDDIWTIEKEQEGEERPLIPDLLVQIYNQQFDTIEESIRSDNPEPKNAQEFLEINNKILGAQQNYCFNFLDPESDELFTVISDAWPQIKEQEELEFASYQEWIDYFLDRSRQLSMSVASDWVMNIDQISDSAVHTAFFNALQDHDGSIRRARLLIRSSDFFMPALALKAFSVARNMNPELEVEYEPSTGRKVVKSLTFSNSETEKSGLNPLPVDRFGNLIINYAGPQKMFPYISMADMLTDSETMPIEQRQLDKETGKWVEKKITVNKNEFLKDKILLFGATATAIYDLRVTPFDENFPGAETHVNIVDNLVRNDFLFVSRDEEQRMPIFLLCLGIVLSLLLTQLGAVSGLLLTASLATATITVDQIYFFQNGMVLAIMFPIFLIGSVYVSLTFYKYFTEERGKKELKQTFQKYVSPAVVDEILSDPENIELGGKKMNMTVFFSDVRGFTTISEQLDPRALSDLLNFYLTPMTELVFKNKGTLDKYMGDAVMAFFGAPISYKDHAKHGCRCALQSLEKLSELQLELEKRNLPLIDIGIGLNTGEMSVGNMGSETVRSYTVMGDAVNLGSRLEGINKQYGTRIIISEFTYADVKDDFVCREIDLVRVKGKVEPVKIYELVGEGSVPKEKADLVKKFAEGYALYHSMKFSEAIDTFNQALSIEPDDECSKLYIKRSEDFIASPPPEDWDGVFVMTSK